MISPIPRSLLLPLTAALACMSVSCGPSKKELQQRLAKIDQELSAINDAEHNLNAQSLGANVKAFVSGAAIGYGTVSGDGELAGNGAESAYHAIRDADKIQQASQALATRKLQLQRERVIVSSQL